MRLLQVVYYSLLLAGAALLVAGVAPGLTGGHVNRALVIAVPPVLALAIAARRRWRRAPG